MDSVPMNGYNYFMRTVIMKAWAKINLTLDVIGRRSDGYHDLASVMQSISLHDTLSINKTDHLGIEIKTDCPDLATDESNLIYKAAKSILVAYDVQCGISIELQKKIPIAAGLGGGSSNCAATLHGINTLLNLGISQKELLETGQKLGADVPFCLMSSAKHFGGGTALAEGIGENLTPLPSHPDVWIVLAHLPILVSTPEIFSRWSQLNRNIKTGYKHQTKLKNPQTFRLNLPQSKKNIKESVKVNQLQKKSPGMVKAFASGSINEIANNLGNDLTTVATAMHPEIIDLITELHTQNPLGVNMTGSGPAVFAYFPTESAATKAKEHIQQKFSHCNVFCTKPKI